MNNIADIVAKARRDSMQHTGTDVQVADELGNRIGTGTIRAIVNKDPEVQSDTFGMYSPYRVKFFETDLPGHKEGLVIKCWRGTFRLHALLEQDAGRVTYSLQTV